MQYRIPIRQVVDNTVLWLSQNFADFFDGFNDVVLWVINNLTTGLNSVPYYVIILAFVLLAYWWSGVRAAIFTVLGLLLIVNIGMWRAFTDTLALVLTAELLVLIIGLPMGVLSATSRLAEGIISPILDFMQTMPAFVYLIPAVMFFGIGLVPGVVATVIFAIPPLVRLTSLGIKNVPKDLVEASEAFGATRMQMLMKVQLPVAMPTLMAGVNQSIMLGLSMVVIAAMIGAGGLGQLVLRGIQRLEIGMGFEAGLAVVIMAIVLDRITQGFATKRGRSGH